IITFVAFAFCEAWWHVYSFVLCVGLSRLLLLTCDDDGDNALKLLKEYIKSLHKLIMGSSDCKKSRELTDTAFIDTIMRAIELEGLVKSSRCAELMEVEDDNNQFMWKSILPTNNTLPSFWRELEDVSSEPCRSTAAFLELLLEKLPHKEFQWQGLTILFRDNKLYFYISGEVALSDLQNLCEFYQHH
ncbi:MAG: hypothetical protein LBT56_08765, partial [Prevotellaceae bacterium]|nr:hypothetical protein [Prevotellaceae bacterium]